jgi:dTDP-glucose 4,6-dehydratase
VESFARLNERLKLDAEAVVLTRDPLAFQHKAPHLANHPAIRLHQGDVRNFIFPVGRFTHVIHAAAERDPRLYAEHPMRMLDMMLSGTRRVLDFSLQSGNPRLLLVSSAAVYGCPPVKPALISEDYPGEPDVRDPHSVFGEGKRLSEMLCLTYAQHYGIQVKIGRCFSSIGPHLPLAAYCTAGRFLQEGLQGGPIRVNGNRAETSSFLYAADLAVWLWTILLHGECGRAYNVGSELAVTMADLARQIGQAFAPPVEVSFQPQDASPGQVESGLPCTRAAQERLQLKQEIDLEEAIRRTVAWMSQPHRTPEVS